MIQMGTSYAFSGLPPEGVSPASGIDLRVCLRPSMLSHPTPVRHMTLDSTITIHVPSPLRTSSAGASELPVSARSIRAALEELERSHPELYRSICDETGAVRRHVNLFVNSRHIRDREGLDTPLSPGDVVMILPAVSGG